MMNSAYLNVSFQFKNNKLFVSDMVTRENQMLLLKKKEIQPLFISCIFHFNHMNCVHSLMQRSAYLANFKS